MRLMKYGLAANGDGNSKIGQREVFIGERGIRAKVTLYNGQIKFHVRHYGHDEERRQWYPTRKGVTMNLEELYDLVKKMPHLAELMQSLEFKNCKRKRDLEECDQAVKRSKGNDMYGNYNPNYGPEQH